MNPSSISPSELKLKIGALIILLRNINPYQSLYDRTRITVIHLHRACLEAYILGRDYNRELHLLPYIKLSTTEEELPFILTCKQFLVRLCFAMTVNKVQGQSLDIVGVDLHFLSFTHGQLYVALSRVTDLSKLSVLLKENAGRFVENIVYPEVLL